MHPARHYNEEPGDDGETVSLLDGFHELDSSEQVVWVAKPKRIC